ncbi:MAG TPA: hypothetical protein VFM58_21515, partial [Solirubrobacteraceae bacterium]|nr:hypothetical protein [Solirubrobacteraceae bacterium]
MSLPIRARMTAWYVALLALVVGAVGAFLVLRLRADLTDGLDRGLRPAVAQIAHDYRKEGPRELRDSAQTVLGGERVAAQVLDAGGEVVVAYGDPVAQVPMVSGAAAARAGTTVRTVALGSPAQDFRVAARRVVRDGEQQAVVAAESLAPVQR